MDNPKPIHHPTMLISKNPPQVTINDLPHEILVQILKHYVFFRRHLAFCTHDITMNDSSSPNYIHLLRLRLVSKTWADVIICSYFEELDIREPSRANQILNTWPTFYPQAPDYSLISSPVRTLRVTMWYNPPKSNHTNSSRESFETLSSEADVNLSLDNLQLNPTLENSSTINHDTSLTMGLDQELDPEYDHSDDYDPLVQEADQMSDPGTEFDDESETSSIGSPETCESEQCSVDQVIELIELLDSNITQLEITFSNSFGFPARLVNAISRMNRLTSLSIKYIYDKRYPVGFIRRKTFISLLRSIPQLRKLRLQCRDLLPDFTSSGLHLPNLRHLIIFDIHGRTDTGILSLCQLLRDQIRTLDHSSASVHCDYVVPMFEMFRKNMQALHFESIGSADLQSVSGMEFPNLRFFAPLPFPFYQGVPNPFTESSADVLAFKMLRQVQTVILTHAQDKTWIDFLNLYRSPQAQSQPLPQSQLQHLNQPQPHPHHISKPQTPIQNPFQWLPNLRKIVCSRTRVDKYPPKALEDAFGSFGLECQFVHLLLPRTEVMVSEDGFDS